MKKKRKIVLFVLIALVAVGGLSGYAYFSALAAGLSPTVSHTVLASGDLTNSINIRGVVESTNRRNVYAATNLIMDEVFVEIGDFVNAGDVLAVLDIRDLELNINQNRAEISSMEESNQLNYEQSARVYNTARDNLNIGQNAQVLNAQNAVSNAEINLINALLAYENARTDLSLHDPYAPNSAITQAQSQIIQAQSQINQSQGQTTQAQGQITQAQGQMAQAQGQITQARAQVTQAEVALTNATQNLENIQRIHNITQSLFEAGGATRNDFENSLANLQAAQTAVDAAQAAYNTTRQGYEITSQSYEVARQGYEIARQSYEITRQSHDVTAQSYGLARQSYNETRQTLQTANRDTVTHLERVVENTQNQVTAARLALENAQATLDNALLAASQEVDRLQNTVELSQTALNNDARIIALERLERQLDDAIITAPISGTITASFAYEGRVASGLMFVIEDTDNLKITTRIREYDATQVRPGMAVEIRTDSTGADVFYGEIAQIDPTALRNAAGDVISTTDVEFGAEIYVTSQGTPLLIGMNTRLNVILDRRYDVLFVPFDAIWESAEGDTYVFVAEADGQTNATVRQVPVTIGLESDFFTEISGNALTPGMIVINNAMTVTPGMSISLN